MKLTRTKIVSILEGWPTDFTQTPEAFELENGWCLRSGSGIAGEGATWFLWHAKGTGEKTRSATSPKELRALLDACPGVRCRTCRGTRRIGRDGTSPHFDLNYPRTSAFGKLPRLCKRCNATGYGPRQPLLATPRRFRKRRTHGETCMCINCLIERRATTGSCIPGKGR